MNIHQEFKMVKQVLIKERWMFNKILFTCLCISLIIHHYSINPCFTILEHWWRFIITESFERWLSFVIDSTLLDYFVFQFSPDVYIYIYIYIYIYMCVCVIVCELQLRKSLHRFLLLTDIQWLTHLLVITLQNFT